MAQPPTTKRKESYKAKMGRPPGSFRGPNKSTVEAREAISKFVNKNAYRLQKWLDEIANGVTVPLTDEHGNIIKGKFMYVVQPNPEKAFNLFQSVIEYHVPKLARTEHTTDPDNPFIIQMTSTDADL